MATPIFPTLRQPARHGGRGACVRGGNRFPQCHCNWWNFSKELHREQQLQMALSLVQFDRATCENLMSSPVPIRSSSSGSQYPFQSHTHTQAPIPPHHHLHLYSLSKPHSSPISHPHHPFRPRTPLGMTNVESLGKVRLLYCLLLASRRPKLPACEHVSLEDWSAQVSWLYVGPLFPLTKGKARPKPSTPVIGF
uniref:HDC08768 n=1 Tax=Drosophila melanogaster TaxID=7227 RepID=Q6ILQ0_DROME|nr:TPA_inf: HDC08768 [Drosophila melanogaster]